MLSLREYLLKGSKMLILNARRVVENAECVRVFCGLVVLIEPVAKHDSIFAKLIELCLEFPDHRKFCGIPVVGIDPFQVPGS